MIFQVYLCAIKFSIIFFLLAALLKAVAGEEQILIREIFYERVRTESP